MKTHTSTLLSCGIINLFLFLFSTMSLGGTMSESMSSQGQMPSVHEMFKDIPQEELLKMMEEGQQFIKYLEENGTPEEKMAFAQAMEETLQSFSEDDWKEFEQIVETVQDKLPPLIIEPKEEIIKRELPAPVVVEPIVDNSLEKMFSLINKAITEIFIKAKSDKVLSERITLGWDKKDSFNEMHRLLQVIHNKKDLIAKLTNPTKEETKKLLESLQNFNKRLQIENDQFVIADTFGLQVDQETTAYNLKKLNKILEFFESAIESLLPKIIKFLEEYEPEALKKIEEHDKIAKSALDHATKIEKQKRPYGNQSYHDRAPSHGKSQNNYRGQNVNPNPSYGNQTRYTNNYNPDNSRQMIDTKKYGKNLSSGGVDSSSKDDKKENKDKKEKDTAKSAYQKSVDLIEDYLIMFGNDDVSAYQAGVNSALGTYKFFGQPIDEQTRKQAEKLELKRSMENPLTKEETVFLKKYEERFQTADKNFSKNTEQAHSYYYSLEESILNISPQINEIESILNKIRPDLEKMNSQELEKLFESSALKDLSKRIDYYHQILRNVQNDLRNKHKLHKLERENIAEEKAYNQLQSTVHELHGLNKKINNANQSLTTFKKAIKSTMARIKREQNKAASRR